ncbi:MAG TPA: ImmA/IrrE family metallo-endopeptidase [Candidatus Acidoferrum sp.]|nr:ImmA/IrrE family metallo-endopeptidase [Candidatus Acidoferrum sp.]
MTAPCLTLRATAKQAIEFRRANGLAFDAPCDIYDVIFRLGIDLQFVDIPSLEGMYLEEPEARRICVSAHRPGGRQRYTAAHELGHHVLRHGTRFDAVVDDIGTVTSSGTEEKAAEAFARYVLMPPRAVQAAFRLRGYDMGSLEPVAIYRAACWLGVGYTTLLNQMFFSLRMLSASDYERLSRTTPKSIKTELVGTIQNCDVWFVDEFWANRRLHAQVGDFISGLQSQTSTHLLAKRDQGMYATSTPGEAVLPLASGGDLTICVSRAAYVGFYEYRYFPE